jgi:hypothetical protein
MLEITRSRTGQPTATLDGIRLHSLYDPVKEAERFAAGASAGRSPGTILLLGAGLGYLISALKAAHPLARLIPVFYSREISSRCAARPDPCWDPDAPTSLDVFLRRQIAELDTGGLLVLEWPASARMYPRLSAGANRAVRQLLQEHRGSLVTTMAAGRQWLSNAFINAVALDSFVDLNPRAPRLPIVIAASGPSLERAVPLLRALRRRLYLWALPSAVPCLSNSGLIPDLVVVTDPSYFALYHLHAAYAQPAQQAAPGRELPLAMPLSAATGAWRLGCPVYPLCQGSFFESDLLALAGLSAPVIPPQGTVAATALELGLRVGKDAVVLAGLDLCHLDIRSHARPNAFEAFLAGQACRLSPLFGQLFTRSLDQAPEEQRAGEKSCRTGLALRTYGGHLAGKSAAGRLYRLHPSIIPLNGMSDLDASGLEALLSAGAHDADSPQFLRRKAAPPRRTRIRRALELLSGYEARLQPAAEEAILPALSADSLALSLAYTIAPARLAKVGRLRRRGECGAADSEARELLQDSRRFLRDLAARLRGGAGREPA